MAGTTDRRRIALPAAALSGNDVVLVLQSQPAAVPALGGVQALGLMGQGPSYGLAGVAVLGLSPQPRANGAYTLSGKVYGGGDPLPSATVKLIDAGTGTQIGLTETDSWSLKHRHP